MRLVHQRTVWREGVQSRLALRSISSPHSARDLPGDGRDGVGIVAEVGRERARRMPQSRCARCRSSSAGVAAACAASTPADYASRRSLRYLSVREISRSMSSRMNRVYGMPRSLARRFRASSSRLGTRILIRSDLIQVREVLIQESLGFLVSPQAWDLPFHGDVRSAPPRFRREKHLFPAFLSAPLADPTVHICTYKVRSPRRRHGPGYANRASRRIVLSAPPAWLWRSAAVRWVQVRGSRPMDI